MLKDKILNCEPGILLYGLTPPKIHLEESERNRIAKIWRDRIESIDVDGIVLYDLQDEINRNKNERIFEFIKTIEPEEYYKNYLKTSVEAIIYKVVGKYDKAEFEQNLKTQSVNLNVFVGASSKEQDISLRLDDAYNIAKKGKFDLFLGGICIPERHAKNASEHLKVASKTINGCKYFITQAVYDLENAKKFIDDYSKLSIQKVPIIFTFTPCGSLKTLEFMKWLGISIPYYFEERLKNSEDILSASVNLSLELFNFLYKYSLAKGVSVGANIESISARKSEIEASLRLLEGIKEIISKTNVSYRS